MTFSEVFNYWPNSGLTGGTGKYPTCLKSLECYTFCKKPWPIGKRWKAEERAQVWAHLTPEAEGMDLFLKAVLTSLHMKHIRERKWKFLSRLPYVGNTYVKEDRNFLSTQKFPFELWWIKSEESLWLGTNSRIKLYSSEMPCSTVKGHLLCRQWTTEGVCFHRYVGINILVS